MKKSLTRFRSLTLMLVALMLLSFLLTGCADNGKSSVSSETSNSTSTESTENESDSTEAELLARREALKTQFLEKANAVTVTETAVKFTDASSENPKEILKNPQTTVGLYASFTTLWYEAGGTVAGCIGGDSSQDLYTTYIGRDITTDSGMTVLATSSSGSKWDTESIIAMNPSLIFCSTAMNGYKTISGPAEAANIPVIAVEYDNFNDYLKWFKVFCNLNGKPELWDSVALPVLDHVLDILLQLPTDNNPTVFSMFSGATDLQANTSNTVVGEMITLMNAVNIADAQNESKADRIEINLEAVYAANPDLIIVQCHAGVDAAKAQVAETYGNNAIWNSLNAVKNGRVYYLEKNLFHNKPNRRFGEAYEALAKILYPELVLE